jgi:hypothetical protein
MKIGSVMRGISAVKRGAGLAVLMAALAGCSSVSGMLGSSSTTQTTTTVDTSIAPDSDADTAPRKDSLTNMILGTPKPGPTAADQAFKADDLPCPEVTVRSGAGTLLLGSKGSIGEVTAMDLRYQGTLVKFARECKTTGGVMTMKVGIEGRIITGPAGGPGQIEVPLRLAVVQEGPNPKTVVAKLARIGVAVNSGTVEFTHIDPDVAFPLPRPLVALENYVVYGGFDPTALTPQRPQAQQRRKR